jgi:hypothetical protein
VGVTSAASNSKGGTVDISDCKITDEVFTHIDHDGTVRHFNASAMLRSAKRYVESGKCEAMTAHLDQQFARFALEQRGIEQWKLDRLEEPYLSAPIISVQWKDGSVLTVDGHHRYVKKAQRGNTEVRMLLFKEWDEFLVTIPQELERFLVVSTNDNQHKETR